ncbi:MAG: carboxymuconolactone decarboxylase family protein [Gemmatimonadaceae bacterium]|nr:carboxymuconolactone decarboxylase family protein [Gemmatimonadaceae bacterium]
MQETGAGGPTLPVIDDRTRYLVRLAAAIAGCTEQKLRTVIAEAHSADWSVEVEEVILQSYLFAGLPRALNAMRTWRAVSRAEPARPATHGYVAMEELRADGETTCAKVYGSSYEQLRENIRALHPELDEWMIVEGYGKVLSRPGLDLKTRELCIVAACASTGQKRQLHSHVRGAMNTGASVREVEDTLNAISNLIAGDSERDAREMLAHLVGK